MEVDENDFAPGDVVIWVVNRDNWADHMGIVSDRSENGKFFVIHNFPVPGFAAKEDLPAAGRCFVQVGNSRAF